MDREAWWTIVRGVIIKESEVLKMSSSYPLSFTVRKLNQSLINSAKVTWLEDSKAERAWFLSLSIQMLFPLDYFFSCNRNYSLSKLKCKSVFCWLLKCFFCFRLDGSKGKTPLFFRSISKHPFRFTHNADF